MSDKTKHPQHYKLPDMPYEAIDVIRAVLGEEGFRKFCRGNSLKYLIRADKKGGIYDLSKARDYIDYEMMGMQEPEEPPKTDDDLRAVLDEYKPAQPEIIRCKECLWRIGRDCTRYLPVYMDDYCGRAKRRGEQDETD